MPKYEKAFFAKINMQNPPKPKSKIWYVRRATDNYLTQFVVCGYEFTENMTLDSLGKAEGFDQHLNFRKAFLPEKNHYWLSRDFSGQELRIIANLSGEPAWINAFLSGGDIHKATAVTMWGEENYTKERRKAAKAINFGLVYGISAKSLAEGLGKEGLNISDKEAQGYIDSFFNKLPAIRQFMDAQANYVQNYRDLPNMYGRKRRFHNFFNEYGKLTGGGERAAYNQPVQSMGADITKLALIKIYDRLIVNPKYHNKIVFKSTIHDEINFSVAYDFVEKAAKYTEELMNHKMPGCPVIITTGLEIGHSMGLTWKFNQDNETLVLTPDIIPFSDIEIAEQKLLS